MSDVRFDAEVVRAEAGRRLDGARWLPRNWALMGALIGYVMGASVAGGLSIAAALTTVVTAAMGYVVGRDHASRARVEAHLALCQLEVESHTRGWLSEARVTLRTLAQPPARRTEEPVEAPRRPLASPEVAPPPAVEARPASLRRPQPSADAPVVEAPAAPAWSEVPTPERTLPTGTYVVFTDPVVPKDPVAAEAEPPPYAEPEPQAALAAEVEPTRPTTPPWETEDELPAYAAREEEPGGDATGEADGPAPDDSWYAEEFGVEGAEADAAPTDDAPPAEEHGDDGVADAAVSDAIASAPSPQAEARDRSGGSRGGRRSRRGRGPTAEGSPG